MNSSESVLPSIAAPVVNAENPWPGLLPFTEEMRKFYHGRDAEAADLLGSIRRANVTILYGKSGLGKTSLLRARIFPQLRDQEFHPIYLKPDYMARAGTAIEYVRSRIAAELKAIDVDAPAPRENETLWEYFYTKGREFWRGGFEPVKLVLVLDQFEEIFTLGRATEPARRAGEELIAELGALIEGRAPDETRRRVDRAPQRAEEFRQDNAPCKLVLSLREDYLAELEELAKVYPHLRHNRMALRPLTGLQARDIILKPGADFVDPLVVPQILRLVSGGERSQFDATLTDGALENALENVEIDPALLSLFCRELNNRRLKLQGDSGTPAKIDANLVNEDAGREILQTFYEGCWDGIPTEVRSWLEDNLVTEDGYRDSVALSKVLKQPRFSPDIIHRLVARRLLRCEEDEHLGPRRVELTHDVLLALVKTSRDVRKERLARERELTDAQTAAELAAKAREEAEERERERQQQLDKAKRRTMRAVVAGAFFFLLACAAIILGWVANIRGTRLSSTESALEKTNQDLKRRNEDLIVIQDQLKAQNAELLKIQAALSSATKEETAAASRARAALRLTAVAGQETIDLVLREDIGLPPNGARKLLESAGKLYGGFSQEEIKLVPEALKGRAHLQLAYGRLYLDGASSELGMDRFARARDAAKECARFAEELAAIPDQAIFATELRAQARRLEGDALYAEVEPYYRLDPPQRPAKYRVLTEAYRAALQAYKDSFSLFQELNRPGTDGPSPTFGNAAELVRAYTRLGDAYRRIGECLAEDSRRDQVAFREQFDAAEQQYNTALKLALSLKYSGPEANRVVKDVLADTHNKVANIQSVRWNFFAGRPDSSLLEQARLQYEKSRVLRSELARDFRELPQYQRRLAMTIGNLAGVLLEQKKLRDARDRFVERIDIDRRLYESDPGNLHWRAALAEGYYNFARHLLDRSRFNEPKAGLEPARQAATLSQERNPLHLKVYSRALRVAGDTKEAARVEAALKALPKELLELAPERENGSPESAEQENSASQ